MKRLPLSLVLLLAFASRADDKPVTLNGDKTKVTVTFEAAPNRGERAYKTYCHHCHGENGDGTGHIGKGLVIKPVDLTIPDGAARFTAQNIAHVVREGSGKPGAAMIPWKTVLPEEAIKDVAVYTADLAARGRAKRLAK
ncbi:MAG: cytochrome c [Archangiaceae bacterium]|nr:cytochrome c [Archangiaceae bacterium]